MLQLNQISWLGKNLAQQSHQIVRIHFFRKKNEYWTRLEKCQTTNPLPGDFWQKASAEQEAFWHPTDSQKAACQPVGPQMNWGSWVWRSGRCELPINSETFAVYVLPDGTSHECELVWEANTPAVTGSTQKKKVLRLHPLFLKWSLDENNQ